MIKKIKENQYIEKIRELRKKPRTRAAISLLLWGIFFLFVFVALDVRGNHTKEPPVYHVTWKWENEKNYKYQMTFTINQDTFLVNGIRNGEKEAFSLQEQTYYLEDKHLYIFQNDTKVLQEYTTLLGYDFLKLRPEFLSQLLSHGELEYTTNYESGQVSKGYSINTAKFVSLLDGLEIIDDSTIKMEVLENNHMITEVKIDLTNYQKYSEEIIDSYQVKIVYSDIGTVSNVELE